METVLLKLGKPGRFHCVLLSLLAITWLSVSLGHVAHPFYAFTPKYECVPTAGLQKETRNNNSVVIREDQCSYSVNTIGYNHTTEEFKCTEWRFDGDADRNGRWINTITTEWNLVCDDKQWAVHSTTFYMSGVLVGAFIFGFLADKFGRKKILIICLFCQVPISIAISFQPSFIGYCILKFILGMWLQGISTVAFIYAMEFCVAEYRSIVIIGFSIVFLSGQGIITFLSYVTNDWRHVQLIASFICFLSAPYLWWIPESPRWLLVHGRKEEVVTDFIRKACKMNKLDWNSTREFSEKNLTVPSNTHVINSDENMKSLVKIPRLLIRLIISCYVWFVSSLAYYMVLISVGDLAGNHYINFSVGFAVDLLMIPVTTVLIFRFQRKPFLMAHFFVLAALCLIAGTVPRNVNGIDLSKAITAAALLGKITTSSIMAYVFTYTAECFPTTVRGGCMSICGVAMRLGGTLAPQFIFLKLYTFEAFPYVLIAVMTVLAGVCIIPFPETFTKRLPNTIQEALFEDIEGNTNETTSSDTSQITDHPDEKDAKV